MDCAGKENELDITSFFLNPFRSKVPLNVDDVPKMHKEAMNTVRSLCEEWTQNRLPMVYPKKVIQKEMRKIIIPKKMMEVRPN